MAKIKFLLASVAALFLMAGCSGGEYSFDDVESQKLITKENAQFNAEIWRADHPDFHTWSLSVRPDSTITANCIQGDGRATAVLRNPENRAEKLKLQCNTYSEADGCWTEKEFLERPHLSKQKDKCNTSLPEKAKRLAK